MTVAMGFGLFGANRSFDFSQHQDFMGQGWRYSRRGHLPEPAWMFALAVLFHLRGQSLGEAAVVLKSYLMADVHKAYRCLERNPPKLT
jgi:hypothetical protein